MKNPPGIWGDRATALFQGLLLDYAMSVVSGLHLAARVG
jgi:hypothetical protein